MFLKEIQIELARRDFRAKHPLVYNNNKEFYKCAITTPPQSTIPTSINIYKYQHRDGSFYHHDLKRFIAPMDGKPYFSPKGGLWALKFHPEHDIYSFVDDFDGKTRLNINMHGATVRESKLMKYADAGNSYWPPETYAEALPQFLPSKELHDIHHIHMISCLSANGGNEAYAAKVANITGIPTTGYRGTVFSIEAADIRDIYGSHSEFIDLSTELDARPTFGIKNFQQKNAADGSWRPTALKKDFWPAFGSPGFDDMSTFLEEAFVL